MVLATLKDKFDGTVVDSTLWSTFVSTTGSISESGGLLTLNAGATSADNYTEIDSLTTYDLTGSYALVKVNQVLAQNALSIFRLYSGSNVLTFFHDAASNVLHAEYNPSGITTTLGTITYSSAAMKWWKIRENQGTIYFDYSADGFAGNWINLGSVANPFAITALSVKILAYDFSSDAAPGAFKLSNFNVPPIGRFNNSGLRPRPFAPGLAR